jgi:hypothetical protein
MRVPNPRLTWSLPDSLAPAFRASFPRCSPRTPHLLWQSADAVAFLVVLTGRERPRRKSSRQTPPSTAERIGSSRSANRSRLDRLKGTRIDSEGQ